MSDTGFILEALNAGSDVALIAIALAVWRVERRVFIIENEIKTFKEKIS